MSDDLGDRMKQYEYAYRFKLPRRLPVIIRVDGKAFHTLTRPYDRPFDKRIEDAMSITALALCNQIDGVVFAYRQSDEISLLVRNDQTLNTQPWFDNNLQKIVSISSAVASVACTTSLQKTAHFDARAFVLPPNEVVNYFVWRQQDASRNSIQMLARSIYSHKDCHRKNTSQLQEMCFQKGHNWNNLPIHRKRGSCFYKVPKKKRYTHGILKYAEVLRYEWTEDKSPPIFCQDRDYISKWLSKMEGS